MSDRRQSARDKMMYGGVVEIDEHGPTRDYAVRNVCENGARIEDRSLLSRIIRWRDHFVGVAFSSEDPSKPPVSDLDERLRKSEQKKLQLQRRIDELLGRG
jgi:hypothetical protein